MKAFIVEESLEGHGEVFFAEHAVVARKNGASCLADGDFGAVSCRRIPALDDKKGDLRAIRRHLLGIGWWFETEPGGCRVYDDDEPFVCSQGHVWRNWMQWLDEVEHHIQTRANRASREAEG